MRHVAQLKNTSTRVIVVFMQLPEDLEHALVVEIDTLPDPTRDYMEDLLRREGQNVKDFGQLLSGRMMPNSSKNVLQALHLAGQLHRVTIDNVVMLPQPHMPIPLREVLEHLGAIARREGQTKTNQFLENDQVGKSESSRQMAGEFIYQAEMLEADARKKRERAYALAPELRPVDPTPIQATATVTTESEVSPTTKQVAPKAKTAVKKTTPKSKTSV